MKNAKGLSFSFFALAALVSGAVTFYAQDGRAETVERVTGTSIILVGPVFKAPDTRACITAPDGVVFCRGDEMPRHQPATLRLPALKIMASPVQAAPVARFPECAGIPGRGVRATGLTDRFGFALPSRTFCGL